MSRTVTMPFNRHDFPFTRRELLRRTGTGLGFLGLAALLADSDGLANRAGQTRTIAIRWHLASRISPSKPSTSSTCS